MQLELSIFFGYTEPEAGGPLVCFGLFSCPCSPFAVKLVRATCITGWDYTSKQVKNTLTYASGLRRICICLRREIKQPARTSSTLIPNILWIQAYTIHTWPRSLNIQTPQMNVPCQQVTNHPLALPTLNSLVLLFTLNRPEGESSAAVFQEAVASWQP